MGDSYDEAQAALQQQQKDMLAAMAQSGSAGQAGFQQAQADMANQKNAAIQAALAEAARRGAPQGMQDSISYQIGAPYDRLSANEGAGNQNFQRSINSDTAAGNTVFNQAIANIPALRAMSQRQAQAEQFKAQQQAQQDALDTQLKQIDLQIANANRDRAQSGSSGNPYRDIIDQLDIKQKVDAMNQPHQQASSLQDAAGHLGGTGSNGYKLLTAIVANPKVKSFTDAMSALAGAYAGENGAPSVKTPHGGTLDRGALESLLANYYGVGG